MNEELVLPETIQKQITSKPKIMKLTFLDKLDILLNWAGEDHRKNEFIGLKKIGDNYFVNPVVLAEHFKIKKRSIERNFTSNQFQRSARQIVPNWILFTKENNFTSIAETYLQLQQELSAEDYQNWDSNMVSYWSQFIKQFPEKLITDFTKQFGSDKTILQLPTLISYLFQSDILDPSLYQSLYFHFSPFDSISGKVTSFLSALFSRGWSIGTGKRTVHLVPHYGFLFNDGKHEHLLINDYHIHYPDAWLFSEESHTHFNIESFFESFYPRETSSNAHYMDSILKQFRHVITTIEHEEDENE